MRQSVTITQPNAALSATLSVTSNVNCYGGNNGSASATPTGGTPGYTYSWSPGSGSTQSISNLTSGSYSVTITDSKGCKHVQTVSISQPSTYPNLTNTTTPASCIKNDGIGGTRHQWNYGDSLPNLIQDTILNPGHLFKDSGTYVIRLISFNS